MASGSGVWARNKKGKLKDVTRAQRRANELAQARRMMQAASNSTRRAKGF